MLTASDLVDEEIIRPLARGLGLPLVGLSTPIQQVADILGNADAYIGGRWHPAIFAMRGRDAVAPSVGNDFQDAGAIGTVRSYHTAL